MILYVSRVSKNYRLKKKIFKLKEFSFPLVFFSIFFFSFTNYTRKQNKKIETYFCIYVCVWIVVDSMLCSTKLENFFRGERIPSLENSKSLTLYFKGELLFFYFSSTTTRKHCCFTRKTLVVFCFVLFTHPFLFFIILLFNIVCFNLCNVAQAFFSFFFFYVLYCLFASPLIISISQIFFF